MRGKRVIFLIHGVGNPKPGNAARDFEKKATTINASFDKLVELNWNELIPKAIQDKKLDHNWLLDLARSMQASADIGIDRTEVGWKDATTCFADRWQNRIVFALRVIAAFAPVLLIWGLLCVLYQVIHVDTGTPWENYRFEAASYKAWWTWIAFLTYPLLVGKWLVAWKFSLLVWALASVLLILVVVLLGIFRKGNFTILVSFRRATLHWLGPVIYTIGLPFVQRIALTVGIVAYLISSTLIGVPDYQYEVATPTTYYLTAEVTFSEYIKWDQAKQVLYILVPIAILATALLYLLSPMLKVAADIFQYLGNSEYRLGIHEGLSDEVQAALGEYSNPEVILAGHSLGSVIALDSLLSRPDLYTAASSVTLVTGGSPLRRLFHRFFPKFYKQPEEELATLKGQYPKIRWINVFRPLDYVGASLFKCKTFGTANLRVPQRGRLHTGYWSDEAVLIAIKHALVTTDFIVSDFTSSTPIAASNRVMDMSNFHGIPPFWEPALPIGIGLFISISFLALDPYLTIENFETQLSDLKVDGTETPGLLYRRNMEVWERSGDWEYIDILTEYWVQFNDNNNNIINTRLDTQFHDEEAIVQELDEFDHLWAKKLPDENRVGMNTSILYLKGQPNHAHAPEFYRQNWFSYWRVPGGVIQFALGFLFGFLLSALPDNLLCIDQGKQTDKFS